MSNRVKPQVLAYGRTSGNINVPLLVLADGTLVSSASIGGASFGALFPSTGVAVGAKDISGNLASFNLDASGNLKIAGSFSAAVAGTSVLSNVSESLASVTLLASNASRLAFEIDNDSDGVLLVKFGATASATSYSYEVMPRDKFSTAILGVNYTGRIDGIWRTTPGTSGHTAARVTELSA